MCRHLEDLLKVDSCSMVSRLSIRVVSRPFCEVLCQVGSAYMKES